MSLFPTFGVSQQDGQLEMLSRCLWNFSVNTMEWSPATGSVVADSGHTAVLSRAATSSVIDSGGVTYTAQNYQLPFEARDWLNAGSRQTLGLKLGTTDQLPFSVSFGQRALTFYFEFIETAINGWRFSISNSGVTGAALYLSVTTGYVLNFHNGTALVSSGAVAATAVGNRVRLRGTLNTNGSVQLFQSVNEAAETSSTASGANALATSWASGSSVYVGSSGTTGGQGWFRRGKIIAAANVDANTMQVVR